MPINLLELFFIFSGIVILVFAFRIARKERFNAVHFLVFLAAGVGLLLFTLLPSLRDWIARIFGISRGAEVLTYMSIVFLFYFVLLLLQKVEHNRQQMTELIRKLAIEETDHAKK